MRPTRTAARAGHGESRRLVPLNTPSRIRVQCRDDGTPLRLRLGRGAPHDVRDVQESWRIDDEWWRVPIRRMYHRLLLDDGRLLTVYHDLESGGWFEQR